jgi:hypothetical protein
MGPSIQPLYYNGTTMETAIMSAKMKLRISKMLEHINYLETHVASRRAADSDEVMLRVEALRDGISDLVDVANAPAML